MKTCPKCKIEKPLSEWGISKDRGLQFYCKECKRKSERDSYHKNAHNRKERVREAVKRCTIKLKDVIAEAKSIGCISCSEKEPACMDFHHVQGDKKFNIADKQHGKVSVAILKEEIAKCVVICSNCHRKLHAGLLTI